MQYFLENPHLKIKINEVGAEVKSLYGKTTDFEYLYQGNPEIWKGSAYHLFPICGRLFNCEYTYKGKTYQMGLHGFSRDFTHNVISQSQNSITFEFLSNEKTKEIYPFDFILNVTHTLDNNRLISSFNVTNPNEEVLPFSIGGHPGFNIPLDPSIKDEEHYLEFSSECLPKKYLFAGNFITGEKAPYPLKDGKRIDFSHRLFYSEGIFLSDMADGITIKANNCDRYVKINYKNASVLGLWHAPGCDAPYICIEPWKGIPSTDGKVDDFSSKNQFVYLDKGQSFTLEYSVEVNE